MKYKDKESIKMVLTQLRAYGINAKAMLERKIKSCDIYASYKNQIYYIEIKDKISPQGPGSYELKYGYNSTINGIIEKAIKQLKSMPIAKEVYKIIWFIIPDNDEEEFILNNIISTLYGLQKVALQRGDLEIEMDCFYFLNNPFMKFTDLDCAVIQTTSGLIYCLNNYSSNYSKLRKTKFFIMHKRKDGVIDPIALEKEKCCLIASPNKPKSEEMMQALLKNYKFNRIWVIKRKKQYFKSETFHVKLPKNNIFHKQ